MAHASNKCQELALSMTHRRSFNGRENELGTRLLVVRWSNQERSYGGQLVVSVMVNWGY